MVGVGEGGGFSWGGGEGRGEKAYNCNWITIKIKKKKNLTNQEEMERNWFPFSLPPLPFPIQSLFSPFLPSVPLLPSSFLSFFCGLKHLLRVLIKCWHSSGYCEGKAERDTVPLVIQHHDGWVWHANNEKQQQTRCYTESMNKYREKRKADWNLP